MNRIDVELEARGVEISGGYGHDPYIYLTLDQVDPRTSNEFNFHI